MLHSSNVRKVRNTGQIEKVEYIVIEVGILPTPTITAILVCYAGLCLGEADWGLLLTLIYNSGPG